MKINTKIGGALLFGVAMLGAAVFLRPEQNGASELATVVIAEENRVPQKINDTDGDGVRDWDEELAGTDPLVPDTSPEVLAKKRALEREKTEVPDTITNRFGLRFFSELIQRKSGGEEMSEEDKQKFLEESIVEMSDVMKTSSFTARDLASLTAASNPIELWNFGTQAGETLGRYTAPNENEIFIFKRAIDSQNFDELTALDPIISAYANTVKDLRAIPTPQLVANEYLRVVNSTENIHSILIAMRNVEKDSLPALVKFKEYVPAVEELDAAIKALDNRILSLGGSPN